MTIRKKKGDLPLCKFDHLVSAHEVCRAYGIEHSFLISMIEYGIIEVRDDQMVESSNIHRIAIASRLHRDLQVNTAGIAVILDLLDALESVKTHLSVLETRNPEACE